MPNNKKAPLNESINNSSENIIAQNDDIKCKDPAILFYTSDFIADTFCLSLEQTGKLALLMAHRHWKGQRLTYNEILKICRDEEPDPEIFSRYKKDSNGYYYNPEIEKAIEKRKQYSESRSRNRKGKCKKYMNNTSKTYDNHIENRNENKRADVNENFINNKEE